MGRSVIVVLALLLLPMAAALEQWGCCVPASGACFPGSGVYNTSAAFQSACTAAGGTIQGAGQQSTCAPLIVTGGVCEMGCCCAGDEVQDSPTINSDESLLGATRYECSLQQGYTFRSKGAATCVSVCGGSTAPQVTGNYTITGIIKNATSNAPLAGATVYIPVPGGERTAAADAAGRYTLQGVPAITARIFASHPACRPSQTAPITFRSSLEGVNITLDCTQRACEHAKPAIGQLALVQGTDRATFNVLLDDRCGDLVHFEPLRCDAQFENCRALLPSTSPSIMDRGLENGTTYCYMVRARFTAGVTQSDNTTASCITTGDAACMMRQPNAPATWCGESAGKSSILRCDEKNKLKPTPCEGTSICTMHGGEAACGVPPPCDRCNGLLGLFASAEWTIGHESRTITCEQARELGLCYEDRTRNGRPLMIDAYAACMSVSECGQYRNQGSCEQNVCGVADACRWQTVNEELGIGLCVGTGAPACERCSDLLGYCNRDACLGISDQCYFDEDANGMDRAKGCVSRQHMACRYYDTRQDCIGDGGNAEYNIQLDTAGRRVGGDNGRASSSQDAFRIGACTWIDEKNHCIKDADRNLSALKEDDCYENGRFRSDPGCYEDSTPPNTTFFLASPPVYSRSAVQTLPYTVTDDRSPPQLIRTYVCLQREGEAPCYPNMTLGKLPALPPAGSYRLRFYSIDASQNSEVIKDVPIRLEDSANAALERVEIREDR